MGRMLQQSGFDIHQWHIMFSSPEIHTDTPPPIQWVPATLSL